jgi:hypothetical protein
VRVQEQSGQDNPVGEGDDELINATQTHGSDGMRDDMNDSAWTAPIWFVAPGPPTTTTFVWSINSTVYQRPQLLGGESDCRCESQHGASADQQDQARLPSLVPFQGNDNEQHSCPALQPTLTVPRPSKKQPG